MLIYNIKYKHSSPGYRRLRKEEGYATFWDNLELLDSLALALSCSKSLSISSYWRGARTTESKHTSNQIKQDYIYKSKY